MADETNWRFDTLALHGGQEPDPTTGVPGGTYLPDHLVRVQRCGSRGRACSPWSRPATSIPAS